MTPGARRKKEGATPPAPTADRPTPALLRDGGWRVVVLWCSFLALGYLVSTLHATGRVEAARERLHVATTESIYAGEAAAPAADAHRVEAGLYIDRVHGLDVLDAEWFVDAFVWFRWEGDGPEDVGDVHVVDGELLSSELVEELHEGDTHQVTHRISARITKPFDGALLPLDRHVLDLRLEHPRVGADELVFVPDLEGSALSGRVHVPGFAVTDSEVRADLHAYRSSRGDPRLRPDEEVVHSQLVARLTLERAHLGLYVKMFLGLFAAVAIALVAFLVEPTGLGPRFQLGVGAFFAAVAHTAIVARRIPLDDEFGLSETITGAALTTILLSVLTSALSVSIYTRHSQAVARRLDRWALAVMLTGFVTLNVAIGWAATA